MKFHDELNPKLWDKDNNLKQEVYDKLVEITEAFIEYLNVPEDSILDVRITGSSANYNYTPHSDLDLHVIVDYDKVHKDCPIVEGYLWSVKSQFNKEHDIYIYKIPVELYAEDSRVEAISNGCYSIMNDEWIKRPEKIPPTNNDAAVEAKYNELKEAVDRCDDSEEAQELQDKIYQMRKTGLTEAGELSTENLAFKKLRDAGCIDKLKQIKKQKIDKELTLESYNENKYHKVVADDKSQRLQKLQTRPGRRKNIKVKATGEMGNSFDGPVPMYKDIRTGYIYRLTKDNTLLDAFGDVHDQFEIIEESLKESKDDLTNFCIIVDGNYDWLKEYGTFKSCKAAQDWLNKHGEEDWMYSQLSKQDLEDLGIDEFGYINESIEYLDVTMEYGRPEARFVIEDGNLMFGQKVIGKNIKRENIGKRIKNFAKNYIGKTVDMVVDQEGNVLYSITESIECPNNREDLINKFNGTFKLGGHILEVSNLYNKKEGNFSGGFGKSYSVDGKIFNSFDKAITYMKKLTKALKENKMNESYTIQNVESLEKAKAIIKQKFQPKDFKVSETTGIIFDGKKNIAQYGKNSKQLVIFESAQKNEAFYKYIEDVPTIEIAKALKELGIKEPYSTQKAKIADKLAKHFGLRVVPSPIDMIPVLNSLPYFKESAQKNEDTNEPMFKVGDKVKIMVSMYKGKFRTGTIKDILAAHKYEVEIDPVEDSDDKKVSVYYTKDLEKLKASKPESYRKLTRSINIKELNEDIEKVLNETEDELIEYTFKKEDFKSTKDFDMVEERLQKDLDNELNAKYRNNIRHDLRIIKDWDREFHKSDKN